MYSCCGVVLAGRQRSSKPLLSQSPGWFEMALFSYIANMWVWNWLPNWEMFAPGSLFPNFKPFSIWEIPYVLCFVTSCCLPLKILCQTWFLHVLHYGLPGPPQQSCLISPKFLPLVCAVLTGLSSSSGQISLHGFLDLAGAWEEQVMVLKHTGDMTASSDLEASGWQSSWKPLGFSRESCPLSVGGRIREENGGKGMGK